MSWPQAAIPLGSVLDVRYGKACAASDRDVRGLYPVVGSAGEMARTYKPLVLNPAIVIGRKGNVGQSHYFEAGCWPTDTTFYVEPGADIDPLFLLLQLEHLNLRSLDRSTATPSLRREDLEAQPIVLPPVPDQRRVVAMLEEHLSDLDAAAAGLARVERRSATLIDSVLRKGFSGVLFEDDLSEGSGADLVRRITGRESPTDGHPGYPTWVTAKLGDLFEVGVGATPSRGNAELWSGDLPWVSSGEVAFNRIKTTKETIHRAAAGSPTTRIHPAGTVLLAMIGEGKTRGQAAILDIEAAHNQNCASIRVGRTPIPPEYVYYFLKRRYVETRSAASGGNQPALNKARVQAIEIPVAPLATQRRLVTAFDRVTSASGRLIAATDRSRRRGEIARRALLAAAFSGRLTGHGSDTDVISELAEEEPV